jgi:hypothetical protein
MVAFVMVAVGQRLAGIVVFVGYLAIDRLIINRPLRTRLGIPAATTSILISPPVRRSSRIAPSRLRNRTPPFTAWPGESRCGASHSIHSLR